MLWLPRLEEDGFFPNLEAMAAGLKEAFDAEELAEEIPYVVHPCVPSSLRAPDAFDLLQSQCVLQKAPNGILGQLDAQALQTTLDSWFKEHQTPWWDTDRKRVIVLLPEERTKLYHAALSKESK